MADRIGVVGAGVMGAGIAQALAASGCEVVCHDVAPEALDRARRDIRSGRYGLDAAVTRGLIDASAAEAVVARISFTRDLSEAADVDVVVEAVPEDLDLKLAVLRHLDETAPPGTIFASNSSGHPVATLAAATRRPELVVVWHWASPAVVMRFAEIVRGPATADHVVERITALAAAAGKNPIVIADSPDQWGYVANRLYGAMIAAAQAVVAEGIAAPAEVDQLMMDAFRWPSGPFGMVAGARAGWS
ncbi:MAG TPA: 3-hydroxyacyl-CoA dehydrogenase family protein [Amycolatopsis sp.]|nr:3-hydroxyacyl-CoA dehydrogenase family protein [Amycolatopsis sp.]